MNNINDAIALYANIQDMNQNNQSALVAYLLRLKFENSPENDGAKTETEKLHKALGIVIKEMELGESSELLRIGAVFAELLKKFHPEFT